MKATSSRRTFILPVMLPLLAGSFLVYSASFAQSTASSQVEELRVTAVPPSVGGTVVKEYVPKSRAEITQEYIATQGAGQSILQTINLVPGVNFTNNDPYGSSGGNLRIRSFDGPRISLTWDGMPLNDSGNYSIFSNQTMDAELISRAQVNLGTTDVDSPTASATGGTVSYTSRRPAPEFGGFAVLSGGSFSYGRELVVIDTGPIGNTGITGWIAGSYQKYEKFKGPGNLTKAQGNFLFRRAFGEDGDFVMVAGHWNQNRNNFYRNPTLVQYTQGNAFEEFATCVRDSPTPGTRDDDGFAPSGVTSDNPNYPAGCTNYYNLRINPSNTGNLRGQSSFHLTPSVRLTVDPSFQYVLANGGGTTLLSESGTSALTKQLLGKAAEGPTPILAYDLNGDGDVMDTIRYYSPNNTNTRRYGLTSSLIWDINTNHRVRIAYTYDRAHHRQTGEWTSLTPGGDPLNDFGGRGGGFGVSDDPGLLVKGPDGSFMRQRDRLSIALLNQAAFDYNGSFLDDALRINAGVRAPFFQRDLNNYCFTNTAGFGYCTTSSIASTNADGTVFLVGQPGVKYLPPFHAIKKYSKVLPNVGVNYAFAAGHSIYLSFAEGLSAPRTDNLYSFSIPNVQPEFTQSYDLGYRYQQGSVLASVAVWDVKYKNRIVTSFDQDLGISIDRNVGQANIWGVDGQVGFRPFDGLSLYLTASYDHSKVESNVQFNATTILPTLGKKFPETPDWTLGGRTEWNHGPVRVGFQAKYVGERFSTDVNDESVPAYIVADLDIRYSLPEMWGKRSYLQLNVTNLFDEMYLGGISTKQNALTIPAYGGGSTAIGGVAPTYTVGSPRTVQLSLRANF